jgi:hypothetical protein
MRYLATIGSASYRVPSLSITTRFFASFAPLPINHEIATSSDQGFAAVGSRRCEAGSLSSDRKHGVGQQNGENDELLPCTIAYQMPKEAG